MIDYVCSMCGARGVKLWRQTNTCAIAIDLLCAPCACIDQKTNLFPNVEGMIEKEDGWVSDQFPFLVPAVPTPDNETYWGYTSVPEDGVLWWKSLPKWPPPKPTDKAHTTLQAIADAEPANSPYTYSGACDRCRELIALAREGLEEGST